MKVLISAAALVIALGSAAPAIAQSHVIGGKTVPEHQIESVQARCDELRAEATASTDATAPENDAATSSTTAADDAATPATDATAGTDAAVAADEIDLATLTVALCDEGGFTASAM